jgi:hypothetical protein
MSKVILNCVPPFAVNYPSPPLSILQTWLTKHDIDTSDTITHFLIAFRLCVLRKQEVVYPMIHVELIGEVKVFIPELLVFFYKLRTICRFFIPLP